MSVKKPIEKCRVISAETDIEGTVYTTYGIEYKNRRISDLSVDRQAVRELADMIESCDVDEVHIDYVIEDFLARQNGDFYLI